VSQFTQEPEANTLGVVIGKRGKAQPTGVAKAFRQASARGATLGTGYLGVGAAVLCAIETIYGLSLFASRIESYPDLLPVTVAWLLYLAALVTAVVALSVLGERLPNWLFIVYILMLGSVVALDFVAIWPLGNIGQYATASVSAGFALLIVVALRGGREVLVVIALLAAAFVAAIVLTTPLTAETIPTQLATLSLAVLPPTLGIVVVRGFRSMVQAELERVLVASTTSAPRFAVGMLASEELARLDLAAEELLDSVGTGRSPLPLGPKTASTAASLATELRLHLIEGRRETWLYHAVTESEVLGKSVTLTDPGSLAGLLDPAQRDGLLSAAWLLVSDRAKAGTPRTAHVTLGPVTGAAQQGAMGNTIVVPIVIATIGVPRNRVDPATWDAISRVGRYSDSTQNSSLRVDVECIVENPADK
jgi:hypothetical protein